jgi:hypothetical protein
LVVISGCDGCRPDPLVERKNELDDIDKRKKLTKPLDDFVMTTAQTLPPDDTAVRPLAKPGHWVTTFQEIKANNFDASAELRSAATDSQGEVLPVPRTLYQMAGFQPVQLPKGQSRRFETTYLIPLEAGNLTRQVWLDRQLQAVRGGNALLAPDRVPIAVMPDYQYFFVVLSAAPDRYSFLKSLTTFSAPRSDLQDNETLLLYRVLLPTIDRLAPLPDHSLTWTSIAYLLLDDFDPTWLTPEQELAFLDWLHWGGQAIISGPRSLDRLRGSFLEPYLAADSKRTIELSSEALAELDRNWSLPADVKSGRSRNLQLRAEKPMVGVELAPHEQSTAVRGCGELVYERAVGRGRVVVTAFSLADPYLLQWGPSYDSFMNGCLVRRPARQFQVTEFLPQADFVDGRIKRYFSDPRLSTRLRYWSRDTLAIPVTRPAAPQPEAQNRDEGSSTLAQANEEDLPQLEERSAGVGGVGAWNDESGVSASARAALEDAAGISIPRGDFVLRVLAIYLLVLAPLNWAFFRLLGRVEWAWVAAPVIAVVGALAVIRLAQLDIGFARSFTEIAVVEMQGGYPRGHVSRYVALYTSLSTAYDFQFDDSKSSVALPLSLRATRRNQADPIQEVSVHQEANLRLEGFQVASNSVGYLHTEQYLDAGGSFQIVQDESKAWQLRNDSTFSLRDVGLVYRDPDGTLQTAWFDKLMPGMTTPVDLRPQSMDAMTIPEWKRSLTTLSYEAQAADLLQELDTDQDGKLTRAEVAKNAAVAAAFDRIDLASEGQRGSWGASELRDWCRETRSGELSLGELFSLAATQPRLARGEMRLIGWTDQELPQLHVEPTSSQVTRRTLVLVQLRGGRFPNPAPDINCLADVVTDPAPATENEGRSNSSPPPTTNRLPGTPPAPRSPNSPEPASGQAAPSATPSGDVAPAPPSPSAPDS